MAIKLIKRYLLILISILLIIACKKQSYIPLSNNANLASLAFSSSLKLEEKFLSSSFNYNLKVPRVLKGFFIIAIPDNPASKCTLYLEDEKLALTYVPISSLPSLIQSFKLSILVTAPDGNKQTYIINIKII